MSVSSSEEVAVLTTREYQKLAEVTGTKNLDEIREKLRTVVTYCYLHDRNKALNA